ncbi:MAG TPA: AMP-binding protein [Spirochaetota bacterium]|nr:AMP-binding protein [Spirochaetota bacterium]HPD78875.1 AMP-binding protein [Spirochaetota bacterium]HRU64442.1 AMP-binding protein [Spirochaetota bacterium]
MNSLYDYYTEVCSKYSDNILFTTGLTYRDTYKLIEERGAFLQKKGYGKGDVLAILSPNSIDMCITFMAITAIGAIVLPLDPNLDKNNYPHMIKKAQAKALWTTVDFKGIFSEIPIYDISLSTNMEREGKIKNPNCCEEDISSLFFTSGTTGEPKIVQLTQGNLFKTAFANAHFCKTTSEDMILSLLPLFHAYGLIAAFLGPMAHGSSICLQPSLKGPDILKSLAENPITFFPAVPLLWELIMDGIINKVKLESKWKFRLFMFFLEYGIFFRKVGLKFIPDMIFKPVKKAFGPKMRIMVSGGAPLKRIYAKYYLSMGLPLIQGYGLSETTGPITIANYNKIKIGSIGKVLEGNEVKIHNINSDGIGELCFKGINVMPGYFNNPQKNDEVFDSEGFFHTGDLGRIDKDGEIFITGRIKNVIVLPSGKNVYPEELESYYKSSSLIQEIAVFGLDTEEGERVFAVIVPSIKNDSAYSLVKDELNRLNKGLPTYKMVTAFAVSLEPLPVNSTRKILYDKVRENLLNGLYMTGEDDTAALVTELLPQSPAEEHVINILKDRFKRDKIFARETMSDMGVDSLGLIDLLAHLEEKLNVTIDLSRMKQIQTMDELVIYLMSLEEKEGEGIDRKLFESEIIQKPLPFFNPLYNGFIAIFSAISKFFWHFEVKNPENLKFDNNIIAANHTSYLDMVWLAVSTPVKYRKFVYVAGSADLKLLRYGFPFLPVIWVDKNNTLDVIKRSADILRQGYNLIIFPEGGRTSTGKMMEFKIGAAFIAKNLNKKIIPVTINGAYDIWSRHSFLPKFNRRLKGNIVVGKAIDPLDFKSVQDLNDALKENIASNLEDLNNTGWFL